jgi:hypothetical protein
MRTLASLFTLLLMTIAFAPDASAQEYSVAPSASMVVQTHQADAALGVTGSAVQGTDRFDLGLQATTHFGVQTQDTRWELFGGPSLALIDGENTSVAAVGNVGFAYHDAAAEWNAISGGGLEVRNGPVFVTGGVNHQHGYGVTVPYAGVGVNL